MIDREKVIKGMESLHTRLLDAATRDKIAMLDAMIVSDALALLKAQEPRVLALDEIHRGIVVWLEDKDKPDTILAIGGASAGKAKCFITVDDTSVRAWDDEYNVRWRAWTSEPTDEQRQAVKWE